MTETPTSCRLCEGRCGAIATVADGRISDLRGDPNDPVSRGFLCEAGRAGTAWPTDPRRRRRPLRREGDRFVEVDWDVATRAIGEQLRAIRRSDPRSVAVYAGAPVGPSTRDLVRVAAFAVAMGTPNLFSTLASSASPWLYAVERVIGHAAPLQADVSRAHHVLLLAGDQDHGDWGPLQEGGGLGPSLRAAKSAKKARLVVADPRRTPLAALADVYLPIRPGTEAFLLLGLLQATLERGLVDRQYVADHTVGVDALRDAVARFSPETVAGVCGVDAEAIGGVALKLARAAMAAVHKGRSMLVSEPATVGSFALLALSAVTANLLRPGGLYDGKGLVDLEPMLQGAPRGVPARLGATPVGLQLPATVLGDEVRTPGDGRVRALVCVEGDPDGAVPGDLGLAGLDLLVCIESLPTRTSRHAHWILPTLTPWERADGNLHESGLLPHRLARLSPPVVEPPADARAVETILRDLLLATRPPLLGGPWGRRLQVMAHALGRADLVAWELRGWDLLSDVSREELTANPRGVDRGELDRTPWSVSRPDRRVDLAPAPILDAIRRLEAPSWDGDRFVVAGSGRTVDGRLPTADEAAIVQLHPAAAARLGLADGDEVVVAAEGEIVARLALDEALREDAVGVPALWGPAADCGGPGFAAILPDARDPLTNAPALAGAQVGIRRS